jgi:hypothetical protein
MCMYVCVYIYICICIFMCIYIYATKVLSITTNHNNLKSSLLCLQQRTVVEDNGS